jgi:hypothetical protein
VELENLQKNKEKIENEIVNIKNTLKNKEKDFLLLSDVFL